MTLLNSATADAARAVALGRRLGAAVERSGSSYLPSDTLNRLSAGEVFDPLDTDPIADLVSDAMRDLREHVLGHDDGMWLDECCVTPTSPMPVYDLVGEELATVLYLANAFTEAREKVLDAAAGAKALDRLLYS
ncbi:hypothetical protein ORIO_08515 [Cereibacter azotoformans]|uniref:Uncharacterized protein n=1 Tax=Cereibacter sphaeroides (strain ATCC 17025 / ATH 2.4.3) TaxID=349102 RepID=A4WTI4_CERS5|nr:hypothetical protein [Cereibacter azotoformans]ULB09952.1 hypothetical protein ORIO_08515 [Cereibacter azotoformans]